MSNFELVVIIIFIVVMFTVGTLHLIGCVEATKINNGKTISKLVDAVLNYLMAVIGMVFIIIKLTA